MTVPQSHVLDFKNKFSSPNLTLFLERNIWIKNNDEFHFYLKFKLLRVS